MESAKSKNSVLKIVFLVLAAIGMAGGIAFCIYGLTQGISKTARSILIIDIINYCVIALYAFAIYKVPHSNVLRYVMILFALNISIIGIFAYSTVPGNTYPVIIAALVVMFIAGRLGKFKENQILSVVVLAFIVIAQIIAAIRPGGFDFAMLLHGSGKTIQWLSIMIAYIARFYQHKEAGIKEDNELKAG